MGPVTEFHVHCQGPLDDDDLPWLEKSLSVLSSRMAARWPESVLAGLEELEVSLVDDETLAGIHGEFLDDPTPTDVITFPHGEILVSVEMAAAMAVSYGKDARGETLLYLIHGLLHLAGYDDRTEADRKEMARIQEEIWRDWMSR